MSNKEIAKLNHDIIAKLVLEDDLQKMSNEQKTLYYTNFCEALGLNPLTQPFQLLKLQGRVKLYATKDCTEQLRKIHGVSITDITTQEIRGVYVVTAKAKDKDGRTDAATGAVTIDKLMGDSLANALMKAETKAKRRVTLSICGLGMLDETEIETIPNAEMVNLDSKNQLAKEENIQKEETEVKPQSTEDPLKEVEAIVSDRKTFSEAEAKAAVEKVRKISFEKAVSFLEKMKLEKQRRTVKPKETAEGTFAKRGK